MEVSLRLTTSGNLTDRIRVGFFRIFDQDRLVINFSAATFENRDLYFDGIESARNLAFTTVLPAFLRRIALGGLATLEPTASLVVIAELLLSPAGQEDMQREIQDWLRESDRPFVRSHQALRQRISDLSFPVPHTNVCTI